MSADRPENHLCHFLSDAFVSWFVHAIVPSDDLILSGDTSVHSLCHTHTHTSSLPHSQSSPPITSFCWLEDEEDLKMKVPIYQLSSS